MIFGPRDHFDPVYSDHWSFGEGLSQLTWDRLIRLNWPSYVFDRGQGPTFFIFPFFYQYRWSTPCTNKKTVHGPNNFFHVLWPKTACRRITWGVKFFVTPLTILFCVSVHFHSVTSFIWRFLRAQSKPSMANKNFRPHLRDVADFRLFSAFPLRQIFYTTRLLKSKARVWFSVA